CLAGNGAQAVVAKALDGIDEAPAFDGVVTARACDEILVRQGSNGGLLAAHRDVERSSYAVDRVDQALGAGRPSDPLARETVDLGECARDEDIFVCRGER